MRAIIVDDKADFRSKLTRMLLIAGFEVVGEAGDIPEAEHLVKTLLPNMAVVDVRLPGLSGLEGAPRLKAIHPEITIYLISAYSSQAGKLDRLAKDAGAVAFVLKEDLDLELIRSWKDAT